MTRGASEASTSRSISPIRSRNRERAAEAPSAGSEHQSPTPLEHDAPQENPPSSRTSIAPGTPNPKHGATGSNRERATEERRIRGLTGCDRRRALDEWCGAARATARGKGRRSEASPGVGRENGFVSCVRLGWLARDGSGSGRPMDHRSDPKILLLPSRILLLCWIKGIDP